ncbi:MAG: PEP-CTERM sorting domain-containing protein [Gemmatales bacterium]
MRRIIIALVASALAISAVSAQTVIIDTFSNAQTNILRTTTGSTPVLQPDASAVGGFRRVTNIYQSGSGNYDLIFNGSVMQSTADAGVLGSFLLQYGTQAQLNINASATNAFQFERVFLDLASGFTATITSGNGAVVATYTSPATAIPGGGAPSQLVTVPFAAFTNGGLLNLADIDAVTLQFDAAQPATQFQLDNIQFVSVAVPEPATVALLGLAGAGVASGWYLRRRRSQQALNAKFSRI